MTTPLVKICGLSSAATLDAALAAGADLVGFVFFPRSPRNVTIAQAAALAGAARGRCEITALLVDPSDELLDEVAASIQPDWVQLHGAETPERVAAVRARTGRRVMKAVGISDRGDLARVADYAGTADRLLFDAKPPRTAALPGGNGVAFDWAILAGLDRAFPFMLSGGLTVGNVREALRITGAPGVDVSSGVESAPGIKDAGKITAFVEAVRAGA